MRVRPELSQAPASVMQLVTALVNYAGTSEEFLKFTCRIWPRLQVHYGHTHLRLTPSGETEDESVYIELG
jgi:hypothetical protein